MPYDPLVHHRRSIRLKDYDYTLPGAYFVTMNTFHRQRLFGSIQKGVMRPCPAAQIAAACWQRLPAAFNIRLDAWVIMPDHFHGILVIEPARKGEAPASEGRGEAAGAVEAAGKGEASATTTSLIERTNLADASPQPPQPPEPPLPPLRPIGTQPGSLSAILQNFKSVSTRRINQARHTPGVPVWQRDFYEHIIRSEADWERIRRYIQANPLRWKEDQDE